MKLKILLISLLISSLSACSTLNSSGQSPTAEVERNVYTNLPGANGRIFAVKFDDTNQAHPQQGVESADIVYITQVEAGLTRLMGIYSSNYPEILGPIRSARISDLEILAQFGKVGFLYSGAQSKLRTVISQSNLVNLSAERNPPTIYFNDDQRIPPYAMMVKPNLLLEKAIEVESAKSVGWEHGAKAANAKRVSAVTVNWPNAEYGITWSKKEKRFLLSHNGNTNLAESGTQLGSSMMVVQMVEMTPSEYGDKFGGITPKSHTVGSGTAYLLRNGSVTKAVWSRPSVDSTTSWSLEDGSTAYFAPGQVWIFLTDQEPEFIYPVKREP